MNKNFVLLEEKNIEQIDAKMFVYEHEKTKARHIHLKSNNTNFPENGFAIVLNTIPENDTGVAHILEHFVCVGGSKKYDVKSGLFKLIDKSVSKFINAQTANDHTQYLFASDNYKDYLTNMDFYLDSVFHSNLDKQTFLQEGWRYILSKDEKGQDKLNFSGVVLNEMKGYEGQEMLNTLNKIKKVFFKGTVYEHNSGGATMNITDLSFDNLKEFYNKFYHPSNATFFTFSNLPVEQLQEKINNTIESFDYLKINIPNQTYHLTKENNNNINNTYYIEHFDANNKKEDKNPEQNLFLIFKGPTVLEKEKVLKIHILENLLFNPNSSFIKYIEENSLNLGQQLNGYLSFTDQHCFFININNIEKNHIEQVKNQTLSALKDFSKQKWSKEFLLSILDQIKLEEKEQKSNLPAYSLSILNDISKYFKYKEISPAQEYDNDKLYEDIKKEIQDNTFLENTYNLLFNPENLKTIISSPNNELNINKKLNEEEKLNKKLLSLTKEEKAQLLIQEDKLKLYQNESKDYLLPKITKDDLEPEDYRWCIKPSYNKNDILIYDYPKDVSYINMKLEIPFNEDKTVYSSLIEASYYNLINGLISFNNNNLENSIEQLSIDCPDYEVNITNYNKYEGLINKKEKVYLSVSAKQLSEKTPNMINTLNNSFFNANFINSQEKLKTFLIEQKEKLLNTNQVATILYQNTLTSFISNVSKLNQHKNNSLFIKEYNKLLNDIINNNEKQKELLKDIQKFHEKILKTNNRKTINYTLFIKNDLKQDTIKLLEEQKEQFKNISNIKYNNKTINEFLEEKNENINDSNDINYAIVSQVQNNNCASLRNIKDISLKEKAILSVAANYFDKYLYKLLREENGAYSYGAKIMDDTFTIFTQKDPNNLKTLDNINICIKNFHKDLLNNKISQEEIDLTTIKLLKRENLPDTFTQYSKSYNSLIKNDIEMKKRIQEYIKQVNTSDILNVWEKYVINNKPYKNLLLSPKQDMELLKKSGFIIDDVEKNIVEQNKYENKRV